MAHEFGGRLLGEVRECALVEVLTKIRRAREPETGDWTGVRFIDDLARAFARGRRRQVQVQVPVPPGSTQTGGNSTSMPNPNRPRPRATHLQQDDRPPVIEITSVSPAAGKTQLLYLIAVHHLLGSCTNISDTSTTPPSDSISNPTPTSSSQTSPGAVLLLDLTSRTSAPRLLHLLETHLSTLPFTDASSADPSTTKATHIHAHALSALSHIHIFRPQTSASVLSTLASLQTYLSDFSAHYSGDRPLRSILISDLTAFYWQDRHDGEMKAVGMIGKTGSGARGSGGGNPSGEVLRQRWAGIVRELRGLQARFGCVVVGTDGAVATAMGKVVRGRDGGVLEVPGHLPGVWNGFVDVRVVLEREMVSFEGTISAEEALLEQKWRLGSDEGKSAVSRLSVNMWKSEDWEDVVREAVAQVPRRQKCSLRLNTEVEVMHELR